MADVVDSSIRLPSDLSNTGKRLDESLITQDGGTDVFRQRIVVSDPANPNNHAEVVQGGAHLSTSGLVVSVLPSDPQDILRLIWIELRAVRRGLEMIMNDKIEDEIENESH